MKFLSVCSGIEAASVAWGPLGWRAAAVSEIEPFPCELLHHHYGVGRPHSMPDPNEKIPLTAEARKARRAAIKAVAHLPLIAFNEDAPVNLGDMNNFQEWPDATFDVLCGGTPCQSFSNAGLRKGLDDPRGNLMLTFGAIAAKYRPRWLVWENVFGVLSSNGGRDFASFLGLITGQKIAVPKEGWQSSGVVGGIPDAYGAAYRVLDAQYSGLAQRRKRVFVVAYLGDWRRAAAVLLERESLLGNPAPRRGEGEDIAPTVAGGARKRGGYSTDDIQQVAATLDANYGRLQGCSGQDANHGHSHLIPQAYCDVLPTMTSGGGTEASHNQASGMTRENYLVPMVPMAFAENSRAEVRLEDGDGSITGALSAGGGKVGQGMPCIAQAFGGNNTSGPLEISSALSALSALSAHGGSGRMDFESETFIAFQTRGSNSHVDGEIVGTIGTNADSVSGSAPMVAQCVTGAIAFPQNMSSTQVAATEELAPAMGARNPTAVATPMAMRRLTEMECERLQGFPDNYSAITRKGKPAEGGPRYKGLGNSWAVPVVFWIGQRIMEVDAI